jgi:hypothetical protein
VVGSKHSTDDPFDRSTLADIEMKIVKRSKRNTISRLLRANNDRDMIAGWKSDLTKILLIFNVGSLLSVWLSLTVHSQTELAINTNVTVASTHVVVSDIHRTITENLRGADSNNRSVSRTCTPSITE